MSARGDSLPSGIAVIGAACRFPGASDLETFWRNLRGGVESISFFSAEELRAAGVDPALVADPAYVPAKGVLDGVEMFDADLFGMSPRQAERMDPQHRLLLECAWEALEDAGHDPSRHQGPVGVFAGETLSTYLFRLLSDPRVAPSLGSLQAAIGLDRDFLTTLLSYKLGLRGPSLTVQCACSTSLAAVSLACQSLKAFDCDLALAGGVSVRVPTRAGYLYQEGGINSPDGHCRAFDADARGTVGGDGAGMVVLKRLEDALAEGDPVRAVIRGWALNNDGAEKMGFTAPSEEGQAEVIAVAQALAGVEADSITFVEGHGTGTPLGDPIEVAALTRAFRESTDRRGFCALGSVKSNIGHLDAAAGVAGLIKAVLALEHGEIPPTVHFRRPNPATRMEESPFFVNAETLPWESGGAPRRAGVSSFGLGGTNVHMVVEEAPALPEDGAPWRPWHLMVVSAGSATALDAAGARLARWAESHPEAHPADVAWTLQCGRRALPHRRAAVARDLAEGARLLCGEAKGKLWEGVAEGRLPALFLLPGQGVELAGVGGELYRREPVFREVVDECAALLEPQRGLDLRGGLGVEGAPGGGVADREGEGEAGGGGAAAGEAWGERLARTDLAQPFLFTLEIALARLWMAWGARPAALLGHSLGEWVAACLAGVFSLADALALVAERGRLMQGLPAGAMLAVSANEAELAPWLGEELELAAVNAPGLCSVSGPEAAVARLRAALEAEKIPCRPLASSRAFHSAAVEPVLEELQRRVAAVERRPPAVPFVSNLSGDWIEPERAVDPAYWAAQARRPVRFARGLATLLGRDGVPIEVGPGRTLAGLARRQPAALAGRTVLASLPAHGGGEGAGSEQADLVGALGRFWVAGGEVSWDGFQSGLRRHRVSLPTYPFERRRYWVEAAAPASPTGAVARPGSAPAEPGDRAAPGAAHARPRLEEPYTPPRDETERRLAALWAELFGVDRVGVGDDFAELGGDSMLALDLLARVRRLFGVELPLRTLLEAPTVARLARRLRDGDGVEGRGGAAAEGVDGEGAGGGLAGGLVEIRRGRGLTPLALVHPAGGHVLGYRPLAERLGPERPVWGLEAHGVGEGEDPRDSIEAMAADHLSSLLAARPHGPYLLGGASLGGMVAWEMARRLREGGEAVELVALFDTPGPGQMPPPFADEAEALAYLVGSRLGLSAEELRAGGTEGGLRLVVERAAESGALPPGVDVPRARALLELFLTHAGAMMRYQPAPLAGRVVFFRAAERRPADPPNPEIPWIERALDGAEVHIVPGDHGTMYQPPHVEELARRLRRTLGEEE